MKTTNFAKEVLDFQKTAIKMSFDAISSFSGQTAKATDSLLENVPNLPAEGKKVVDTFFAQNEKGLDTLRKHVENGLEIDWTSKEAPAASLEAMESFYNDAFSQASKIKNETNELVEKGTEQLPKEAKSLIAFWNEAVNSGLEIFKSNVDNNFELAKKILANVSDEALKSVKKAA